MYIYLITYCMYITFIYIYIYVYICLYHEYSASCIRFETWKRISRGLCPLSGRWIVVPCAGEVMLMLMSGLHTSTWAALATFESPPPAIKRRRKADASPIISPLRPLLLILHVGISQVVRRAGGPQRTARHKEGPHKLFSWQAKRSSRSFDKDRLMHGTCKLTNISTTNACTDMATSIQILTEMHPVRASILTNAHKETHTSEHRNTFRRTQIGAHTNLTL